MTPFSIKDFSTFLEVVSKMLGNVGKGMPKSLSITEASKTGWLWPNSAPALAFLKALNFSYSK